MLPARHSEVHFKLNTSVLLYVCAAAAAVSVEERDKTKNAQVTLGCVHGKISTKNFLGSPQRITHPRSSYPTASIHVYVIMYACLVPKFPRSFSLHNLGSAGCRCFFVYNDAYMTPQQYEHDAEQDTQHHLAWTTLEAGFLYNEGVQQCKSYTTCPWKNLRDTSPNTPFTGHR